MATVSTSKKPRKPSADPPAAKPAGRTAARKPAKRAPGRPNVDSSPDQRTRLLDAALACYVRRGIGATSLRDIAAAAGVTPALVHYYFGDKPQLLEAVVQERVMPAFAVVRDRVAAAGDDVADLVAAVVGGITEAIGRYPWWPQLWVREVLCDGGALRDLLLTRIVPELARAIAARFATAQAAGRLNPGLDPRLLMTSLIGLVMLPAAGAPIWRQLFDAQDLGLEDLRRHVLALLDRGLELKP